MSDTDYGATGRKDIYKCYKCDPFTFEELEEITFVPEESQVSWVNDSDTKVSATIVFEEPYTDGAKYALRLKHAVEIDGTYVYTMNSIGTFMVDSITVNQNFGYYKTTATCKSVLSCYETDRLVNDFSRSAGDSIIEAIGSLVAMNGKKFIAVEEAYYDNEEQLLIFSSDYLKELGATLLETMIEIASLANCHIDVDTNGVIILEKDLKISEKPVQYEFVDGENCIYVDNTTTTDTRSDVINRVLLYTTTEDSTRRVLVELPSDLEYSYNNIGRHKTDVVSVDSELTDEEMQTQASDYLTEHGGCTKTYEIEHAGIPWLTNVGETVAYTRNGITELCRIEETSFNLKPGQISKTKLKSEIEIAVNSIYWIEPNLGITGGGTDPVTNPENPDWNFINSLVWSIIDGNYGNGEDRISALTNQGYNYNVLQNLVDQTCYYGSWELDSSDYGSIYL